MMVTTKESIEYKLKLEQEESCSGFLIVFIINEAKSGGFCKGFCKGSKKTVDAKLIQRNSL